MVEKFKMIQKNETQEQVNKPINKKCEKSKMGVRTKLNHNGFVNMLKQQGIALRDYLQPFGYGSLA